MSSKPFPDSHTTVTASSVTVRPYLEFSYIRTVPGILKLAQLVLDFLVFICVVAGPYISYGGVGWGAFVSITSFLVTMAFLWMYLFHIIELYSVVPWLLVEMTFCALSAFCYLIASCVIAAGAVRWKFYSHWSSWVVAAEMIMCAIWAILFFITSCVLASFASDLARISFPNSGAYAAAAFFGFVVMVVYGVDCFFKFRAWRANETAQQGVSTGSPNRQTTAPSMHGVSVVH